MTSSIRRVDNQEYLGVITELLLRGETVNLTVSGNSMSPFLIHERDQVLLSPVKDKLKKGDIVLYQRESGDYVLHRLRKVGTEYCQLIGDNQTQLERGVPRSRIIARVTAVRRNGKTLKPGNLCWEFFAKLWLYMIPFRGIIKKIYFSIIGV